MTALDELQQAVTTVAERLDAATVAVGPRPPRLGRRHRRRPGPDLRPQPA